ncbi:hypothetical protein LINPERPRIM_LOCUS4847 [Linum perenne]
MDPTMEQSHYGSRRRRERITDLTVRPQLSSENTKSRRFSGSYITSFREDATKSFTISTSTVSSPGYHLREEIDPSTYSFTTALKALQTRSGLCKSWECLSPEGFALNSKWNEAEKYICNPLSGEVPMECLSAKTLSGRSFYTNSVTMSAPLVYSSSDAHQRRIIVKPAPASKDRQNCNPVSETKTESCGSTRDIGTQSTIPELSSSGSSYPSTKPPLVTEISSPLKKSGAESGGDSTSCNSKMKAAEKTQIEEGTRKTEGRKKNSDVVWRCTSQASSSSQGGCLSWMRKKEREKQKPRNRNIFFRRLEGY